MAPASPQPLVPSGLCVHGRAHGVELELRKLVRARHGVVHEAAGEQLAGLVVVHAVFQQRLADALHQPAVHLALDDHRVDDGAEVVHRGEAVDAHLAGLPVDLDLADVGAARKGEVGRVVEGRFVQARLQLVERVVVRHVGRERHLAERDLLVGALDRELAVGELDVGVARLHQVRRDLLGLGLDLVERLHDGRAAHRDGARAVGAHAEGHAAGVAVHHVDVVHRMPSRAATTCAKVVSWPWPWLCEPVNTVTLPVGCTRISPHSNRPARAPSAPAMFDGAMPQASM
jgi:hypothetical protein